VLAVFLRLLHEALILSDLVNRLSCLHSIIWLNRSASRCRMETGHKQEAIALIC
jgi:hypothetical protein